MCKMIQLALTLPRFKIAKRTASAAIRKALDANDMDAARAALLEAFKAREGVAVAMSACKASTGTRLSKVAAAHIVKHSDRPIDADTLVGMNGPRWAALATLALGGTGRKDACKDAEAIVDAATSC